MNRKSIIVILLAISIVINLLLSVFAFVQKASADTAREHAVSNAEEAKIISKLAKVELDECEGRRTQVEKALEECEERVLAFSNRKH
jgi:hypothetical protein